MLKNKQEVDGRDKPSHDDAARHFCKSLTASWPGEARSAEDIAGRVYPVDRLDEPGG